MSSAYSVKANIQTVYSLVDSGQDGTNPKYRLTRLHPIPQRSITEITLTRVVSDITDQDSQENVSSQKTRSIFSRIIFGSGDEEKEPLLLHYEVDGCYDMTAFKNREIIALRERGDSTSSVVIDSKGDGRVVVDYHGPDDYQEQIDAQGENCCLRILKKFC